MDIETASIQEIGHHSGLPIEVNIAGMSVGGVDFFDETWVPAKVLGCVDARGQKGRTMDGTWLNILLDEPIGDQTKHGLFGRSAAEDHVWVDSPKRVRRRPGDDGLGPAVPAELLALAASGKEDLQALKGYRALTGATLDEARSWLRSVQR